MKLRMLFLAAALLVFASLSFGQGANITVAYTPPGFPLTEEGTTDGTGTPLTSTSNLQAWIDVGADGDQSNDERPVVGPNATQWTQNEVPLGTDLLGPGYHASFTAFAQINGQTPAGLVIYFVATCPDGETPLYFSARYNIISGPNDIVITCPNDGNFDDPCWTPYPDGCVTECVGTTSPFAIQTTPGGHGDVDDPNEYYCLDLCADGPLDIVIGPLRADERPVVSVFPGCLDNPCEVDCPPAQFDYDPSGWVYEPTAGVWTNTIFPLSDGCVCLCLEDILPVEGLNFTAISGNNEVTLNWTVATEINVARYEVERALAGSEAEVIGSVIKGDDYTYVDNDVENGRIYNYNLVEVDVNGIRTPLRTVEAAPSYVATITEYALHQNYPNPFNPTTNIVFDVVEENRVELTIYNAVGQLVAKVADGVYGNGQHTVEFSSDNLTSGLYFYTVKIGSEFSATKKMLLVK